MSPVVVGFDLDMTLVDSAEGISEAIVAVCARHGVEIETAAAMATIGLPLDLVFPQWLPEHPYELLLEQYREHYGRHGIPKSRLLPGAEAAVAAVHEVGGRVVVVSAKKADFVQRVLEVVGLRVDSIHGHLFADAKGPALQGEGAHVYVGDHPGDIAAARSASAYSLVVTTGPTSRADLLAAGPDGLIETLEHFPGWLRGFLAERD